MIRGHSETKRSLDMENNQNNTFRYTYSAKEQAEVKRIRSKYMPREEDKMAQLKKLDASVTGKATTVSLIVGVIGALILGTGMSCCMVWADKLLIPGIVIGLVGMGICGLAYPLYERTLKKERARVAPEILRLTDELMK